MTIYVLICLSLSLVGVAGLQFFYLAYLERVEKAHRQMIRELEKQCKILTKKLNDAEFQINEQSELIETFYDENPIEKEEVWADVIEDA